MPNIDSCFGLFGSCQYYGVAPRVYLQVLAVTAFVLLTPGKPSGLYSDQMSNCLWVLSMHVHHVISGTLHPIKY